MAETHGFPQLVVKDMQVPTSALQRLLDQTVTFQPDAMPPEVLLETPIISSNEQFRSYGREIQYHNYTDHLESAPPQPSIRASWADEMLTPSDMQGRNIKGGRFPERLYIMFASMGRDGTDHIASWQEHGRCFLIHNTKLFVERILPKYFNQSKITSFQRQLNLYGFLRLSAGLDRGAYYHELFLRGRPDLCRLISRKRTDGSGMKPIYATESEPKFYRMRPCPPLMRPSQANRMMAIPSNNGGATTFNTGMATVPTPAPQQQQQQQQTVEKEPPSPTPLSSTLNSLHSRQVSMISFSHGTSSKMSSSDVVKAAVPTLGSSSIFSKRRTTKMLSHTAGPGQQQSTTNSVPTRRSSLSQIGGGAPYLFMSAQPASMFPPYNANDAGEDSSSSILSDCPITELDEMTLKAYEISAFQHVLGPPNMPSNPMA